MVKQSRKPRKPKLYYCNYCSMPFYSSSNHVKYCRNCTKISYTLRNREYMKRHKEKYRKRQRENNLHRRYNISQADYDEMLVAQNNVCAICGLNKEETLQVDHDHITGKVRGLLCGFCNRSYGWLESNKQSIIDYGNRYGECK